MPSDDDVFKKLSVDADTARELRALFDWQPRMLGLADNAPQRPHAPATHPPSFYDKHLAPELQLKQVVFSPTISAELSKLVDKTLISIAESGKQLPDVSNKRGNFVTAVTREEDSFWRTLPASEDDLVANYRAETATPVLPVASVLALHPACGFWRPLLDWGAKSKQTVPNLMADGYLRIVGNLGRTRILEALADPTKVEDRYKPIMDNLLDKEGVGLLLKRFSSLAIWKFKFMTVGAEEFVRGLMANEGPFVWEVGEVEGGCRRHKPPRRPNNPDGSLKIWSLEEAKLFDLYPGTKSSFIPTDPEPPTQRGRGVDNHTDQSINRDRRVRPVVLSLKSSGKLKRKRGEKDDNLHVRSENDRARQWMKEAWIDAVKVDSTLLIFSTGNFEVIGVRHRASQRLYISDIIEPHRYEGYGRLQVGLYMAAILDAIDRAKQLSVSVSKDSGKGDGGADSGSDSEVGDSESGENGEGGTACNGHDKTRGTDGREGDESHSKRMKPSTSGNPFRDTLAGDDATFRPRNCEAQVHRSAPVNNEEVMRLASTRHLAIVHLRYGIFDSVAPSSFLRIGCSLHRESTPNPSHSPPAGRDYRSEEHINITLISEHEACAIGGVHGAILDVYAEDGTCFTQRAYVKLAFTPEQRASLQNEYSVYRVLSTSNVQGVATVLGLFRDTDGGALALVMTDMGEAIEDRKLPVTPMQLDAFLRVLEGIHESGVLHNDIRKRNLVVSRTGDVRIIDFDRAVINASEEALDEEKLRLRCLLEEDCT